ncbi:hypothetical protein GALL_548700 [mine drainage metagenome]|uniref:Uncharacterized protein n=1 Tax=mine drainage metagenome TaxID=410659 RepID=A0A1J5NXS9_9ZZZZ
MSCCHDFCLASLHCADHGIKLANILDGYPGCKQFQGFGRFTCIDQVEIVLLFGLHAFAHLGEPTQILQLPRLFHCLVQASQPFLHFRCSRLVAFSRVFIPDKEKTTCGTLHLDQIELHVYHLLFDIVSQVKRVREPVQGFDAPINRQRDTQHQHEWHQESEQDSFPQIHLDVHDIPFNGFAS